MFDKLISKRTNKHNVNIESNSSKNPNINSLTSQELDKINIKLDLHSKFKLYKEMRKKEPRMWTKLDHIIFVFSDISLINFNIICFYKLYYSNLYNNKILFLQNFRSPLFSLFITGLLLIDLGCLFLIHSHLDIMIFRRNYINISDTDFINLYQSIMFKRVGNLTQ